VLGHLRQLALNLGLQEVFWLSFAALVLAFVAVCFLRIPKVVLQEKERSIKFRRCEMRKQASRWERKPTAPRISAATVAGRRHLTGVPYALPKDDREVSRLDFQHYIYRNVLRGNFLVPLYEPAAILDVAAGTGIWGKDLAHQFPGTRVVWLDLEDIKDGGPLPPNYQFIKGNVLSEQ